MRSYGLHALLSFVFVACSSLAGCTADSAEEDGDAAGESENAASSIDDAHVKAVAECNRVFAAQPGTAQDEAVLAAQRLEGCVEIANNELVSKMATRTGAKDSILFLDSYREGSRDVCLAFFSMDGPVITDRCSARRELLLALLLDAYADSGERRVGIALPNNAYRRCGSEENAIDVACANAQVSEDVMAVVQWRPENAVPRVQRDVRLARETCRVLALRKPAGSATATTNANMANACVVDYLGMAAVIGRTTRR